MKQRVQGSLQIAATGDSIQQKADTGVSILGCGCRSLYRQQVLDSLYSRQQIQESIYQAVGA